MLGRWDLQLVQCDSCCLLFRASSQLAAKFSGLMEGQEGGSRSHPRGQDVLKGRSHNTEISSSGPHQLEFFDQQGPQLPPLLTQMGWANPIG